MADDLNLSSDLIERYIGDPILRIDPVWKTSTLDGGKDNDILTGTELSENLYGWWGDDTLDGGGGHDDIYGHDGNDVLRGRDGSDYLDGGEGNDILDAGGSPWKLSWDYLTRQPEITPEIDILRGGAGNDTFILGEGWFDRYIGDDYAIVADFNWQEDYIEVAQELSHYALRPGSDFGYSPNDTALVLNSNPDDILAIVQNVVPANDSIQLSTRDFKYTPQREREIAWSW